MIHIHYIYKTSLHNEPSQKFQIFHAIMTFNEGQGQSK